MDITTGTIVLAVFGAILIGASLVYTVRVVVDLLRCLK